jgi:hypothetical protein
MILSHDGKPSPKKAHTAVFVSNLYNPHALAKCEDIMRTENDVVLIIDMHFVNEDVMNLLKSKQFENSVYIIVQNEKILSVKEYKLFEKKNAMRKNAVLSALEREKTRMLPDVHFSKAYNLTNDRLFDLLTQYINNGASKE